jgi:deoxyribodipyrimidine photo-lyase
LERLGVILGETYPRPIIDHSFARARALATYGAARHDGERDSE